MTQLQTERGMTQVPAPMMSSVGWVTSLASLKTYGSMSLVPFR